MFSTVLAELNFFWLCFVCVDSGHIFVTKNLLLSNLTVIFPRKNLLLQKVTLKCTNCGCIRPMFISMFLHIVPNKVIWATNSFFMGIISFFYQTYYCTSQYFQKKCCKFSQFEISFPWASKQKGTYFVTKNLILMLLLNVLFLELILIIVLFSWEIETYNPVQLFLLVPEYYLE